MTGVAETTEAAPEEMGATSWKARIFLAIVPAVLLLDWVTKRWALESLPGNPQEILGGLVPLTFALNTGAAFGIMNDGGDSRWFFIPVTLVALGLIATLFRQAEPGDRLRITALSLVVAGALGNLWDRVRWSQGVVDFLGPIDLIFWNFPIFNVADIAISIGAVFLAISFWQEERREGARARAEAAGADGESSQPQGADAAS